jgi:hypothetical protein
MGFLLILNIGEDHFVAGIQVNVNHRCCCKGPVLIVVSGHIKFFKSLQGQIGVPQVEALTKGKTSHLASLANLLSRVQILGHLSDSSGSPQQFN